ncbi:hypothetical protein P0F65_13685 [Sphingomonas sp. I4]
MNGEPQATAQVVSTPNVPRFLLCVEEVDDVLQPRGDAVRRILQRTVLDFIIGNGVGQQICGGRGHRLSTGIAIGSRLATISEVALV